MRTPEQKKYIDDRKHLFWYSPDPKNETVSDELLVEVILNYGSMDDVRTLFSLMDIRNVSNIFFYSIEKSKRRRGNYNEMTINYFSKLFKKYAS